MDADAAGDDGDPVGAVISPAEAVGGFDAAAALGLECQGRREIRPLSNNTAVVHNVAALDISSAIVANMYSHIVKSSWNPVVPLLVY